MIAFTEESTRKKLVVQTGLTTQRGLIIQPIHRSRQNCREQHLTSIMVALDLSAETEKPALGKIEKAWV